MKLHQCPWCVGNVRGVDLCVINNCFWLLRFIYETGRTKGGGFAIFIKKEIEFKQNNINTTTFESVFLELPGSI